MAQKSSFFNANLVNGKYDRVYDAGDWASYFSTFLGNGIAYNPETALAVEAGTGMEVLVSPGAAFINGYRYENSEPLAVSINAANGTYSRITNVVVQLDLGNRNITIETVDGVASPNPVAPDVVQNEGLCQLCIAQVTVGAGASAIVQSNIEDTRANTEICGIMRGLFDDNGEDFNAGIKQIEENTKAINLMNEELDNVISIQNDLPTNFDTALNNGIYYYDQSSQLASITGAPAQQAGILQILNNEDNFTWQIYLTDTNTMYIRNANTSGNTPIWQSWEKLISNSDMNTALSQYATSNSVLQFQGTPANDFNEITESGFYNYDIDSMVTSSKNAPNLSADNSSTAGYLIVCNNGSFIYQTYITYGNTMFMRSYYNWGKVWSGWNRVYTSAIPLEVDNGATINSGITVNGGATLNGEILVNEDIVVNGRITVNTLDVVNSWQSSDQVMYHGFAPEGGTMNIANGSVTYNITGWQMNPYTFSCTTPTNAGKFGVISIKLTGSAGLTVAGSFTIQLNQDYFEGVSSELTIDLPNASIEGGNFYVSKIDSSSVKISTFNNNSYSLGTEEIRLIFTN